MNIDFIRENFSTSQNVDLVTNLSSFGLDISKNLTTICGVKKIIKKSFMKAPIYKI